MEWRQSLHPEWEVSECGWMRCLTDRYRRPAGTVIKGSGDGHGYISYSLVEAGGGGRGAKKVRYRAHTLVLHAFVGPKPSPDHMCAHWDGDRAHNHYSNLRWATSAENTEDKIRHGMHRLGNKRFFEEQVLDMRAMRARGCSYAVIMEKYRVSKGNLSSIINRETWGHI